MDTILSGMKKIRKAKNITFNRLAEMTGISANYLSRMERGLANPSIGTIKKVTDALEIQYMALDGNRLAVIEQNLSKKVEVIRKGNHKMLMYPKSKTVNYLLTPDLKRKLEVILSHANPGESPPEELLSHEGEEFGFVMEGKLEVTIGDEVYVLEEGDSIYYSSEHPHRLESIGEVPCKSIWVITPPSF
ncbi:MAG: cupin domain-containing protein [Desulfobacterales bacterium]|nr:cupin domain-containing protein [Desulfobacterales bacterium]